MRGGNDEDLVADNVKYGKRVEREV